jgi:hypothetical protein
VFLSGGTCFVVADAACVYFWRVLNLVRGVGCCVPSKGSLRTLASGFWSFMRVEVWHRLFRCDDRFGPCWHTVRWSSLMELRHRVTRWLDLRVADWNTESQSRRLNRDARTWNTECAIASGAASLDAYPRATGPITYPSWWCTSTSK